MAKVLVVDDDADLLGLVARRLRHAGHRVQEASCGVDAETVVRDKGLPDVLVLDVNMPDLNGLELLGRVRLQTGQTDLPAVFLSGRVGHDDIAAGQALGAVYLTKPFVTSALLKAVESVLAGSETEPKNEW
jgi:DNA-binding response OmpR family regulator